VRPLDDTSLAYARRVLGAGALSQFCAQAPGNDAIDRVRRWPGYLGSSYDSGRVLLFGAIHNANQLFTPEILELADEVKEWMSAVRTPESDRQYLASVRAAYTASARRWAVNGTVWKRFDKLLACLDIDMEQVAFTNLAKCFCAVGQNETRFVKACLERYPLGALVQDIQPKAVFIAKNAQATNRLEGDVGAKTGALVFRFNNRTGRSPDGRSFRDWAPEAAQAYDNRA
jgi:hypothetical protein